MRWLCSWQVQRRDCLLATLSGNTFTHTHTHRNRDHTHTHIHSHTACEWGQSSGSVATLAVVDVSSKEDASGREDMTLCHAPAPLSALARLPSTNCQLNAPLFGRSLGAHDSCNRENPVRDDLIPYFKVIQVQKCQKGMQT